MTPSDVIAWRGKRGADFDFQVIALLLPQVLNHRNAVAMHARQVF